MEGIKRLEKMLEGQKDRYLILIVNHLMQRTEIESAFLNESKDLKGMAKYIKDKAKKQAKDGVAVIEDEIVFKWSEEYFLKTDEELGIKKSSSNTKKVSESSIKNENSDLNEEFGSIFGPIFSTTEKNIQKKEVEKTEQISIFAY